MVDYIKYLMFNDVLIIKKVGIGYKIYVNCKFNFVFIRLGFFDFFDFIFDVFFILEKF